MIRKNKPPFPFKSLVLIAAGWLALSGAGVSTVLSRPSAREAGALWPANTKLLPAQDAFTLVVFLHPKCVCSDATLTSIARIQKHAQFPVQVKAVFLRP